MIAPLLLLTGKLRPFQVSGTTLSTVVVISLVGSLTYASFGHLNLELAWPIAMGSVAGSIVGALSAKRLSIGLMVTIFVVILPYFALKEFWPSFAAPVIGTNLLSLGMLGFAAGILSGFLGISPNPPKDTDGRREYSGRGWVRELQGRWPGVLG